MTTVRVTDIHCDACIRSMTSVVRELDQAASVDADLDSKLVHVTTTAGDAAVTQALEAAGFTVEPA
jgi:copper chaperone